MNNTPYRTITVGRTLLNCSPLQFEPFTNPEKAVPRVGLLVEAASIFGHTLEHLGALWAVHDEEGSRIVDGMESKRSAMLTWWNRIGLKMVMTRREQESEWEQMAKPGRAPQEGGEDRHAHRIAARSAAIGKMESIWFESCAAMVRHHPMTEGWMNVSVHRDLPRQHSIKAVSRRRAVVDAVANLFDIYGKNLVIHDFMDGAEVDDEALADALMAEFSGLACDGEVAAIMPRFALLVAIQISPRPAAEVFADLREVLTRHAVGNLAELKVHCDLALR